MRSEIKNRLVTRQMLFSYITSRNDSLVLFELCLFVVDVVKCYLSSANVFKNHDRLLRVSVSNISSLR